MALVSFLCPFQKNCPSPSYHHPAPLDTTPQIRFSDGPIAPHVMHAASIYYGGHVGRYGPTGLTAELIRWEPWSKKICGAISVI